MITKAIKKSAETLNHSTAPRRETKNIKLRKMSQTIDRFTLSKPQKLKKQTLKQYQETLKT